MKQLKQFCINLVYCALGIGLFGLMSSGQSFRVPVPSTVTVTVPYKLP